MVTDPLASATLQVIGDTHIGKISPYRLDAITGDVPIVPFAHLHTGDLTDGKSEAQYDAAIEFLDALPSPWYVTIGNRDIKGRSVADWAAAYGMEQNYVVDLGFAVLIVLGPDEAETEDTLSKETMSYLREQLAATDKPCIISTHLPPYDSVLSSDKAIHSSTIDFFISPRDELFDLFADYDNAIAWVSGHTHSPVYAENFVKIVQSGTHDMAYIHASSPYKTNKAKKEKWSPVIPSVYISFLNEGIEVRTRDHAKKEWVKMYRMKYNA